MLGAYLVFGIARIGQSLGKVIVRIILENNWKEYSACPTMEIKDGLIFMHIELNCC
jgi:hypothetical protein